MYAGRIVESADVRTIFNNPLSAVAPVATDEDRSGSKSTSAKETDAVEKELADASVDLLLEFRYQAKQRH